MHVRNIYLCVNAHRTLIIRQVLISQKKYLKNKVKQVNFYFRGAGNAAMRKCCNCGLACGQSSCDFAFIFCDSQSKLISWTSRRRHSQQMAIRRDRKKHLKTLRRGKKLQNGVPRLHVRSPTKVGTDFLFANSSTVYFILLFRSSSGAVKAVNEGAREREGGGGMCLNIAMNFQKMKNVKLQPSHDVTSTQANELGCSKAQWRSNWEVCHHQAAGHQVQSHKKCVWPTSNFIKSYPRKFWSRGSFQTQKRSMRNNQNSNNGRPKKTRTHKRTQKGRPRNLARAKRSRNAPGMDSGEE